MKYFTACLILVFSTHAMASHYWCSKEVSSERTEYASVLTIPSLVVGTSYKNCKSASDCSYGVGEKIASAFNVCNHPSMQACDIKETSSQIQVQCANGVALVFDLDPTMHGQISCLENGQVAKFWDVGFCVKKM